MFWRHAVLTIGILCFGIVGARAERLIFQRGDSLFVGETNGSDSRKFLTVGSGPETLWAVSPDGRRVAWLRHSPGAENAGLATRPATVYLTDILGRRQKKLFATDGVRDRLSRRVSGVGAPGPEGMPTRLDDWAPLSLSWSADGRTLYLGVTRITESAALTTLAIDAATGYALVDAEGRWKAIAPVGQLDARGALLAGVGASVAVAQTGSDAAYTPVMVVDLGEGKTQSVPDEATLNGAKPAYSSAVWPALSPDGKTVAFAAIPRGLWTADLATRTPKSLVRGEVNRPRWSFDGKSLLFLAPRPTVGDKPAYDLYQLPVGGTTPRPLVQDVEWFDLIPD